MEGEKDPENIRCERTAGMKADDEDRHGVGVQVLLIHSR